MENLKLKVACENTDCKHEFFATPGNVKREEFRLLKGGTIWLTYFDCPKCGKRHYVQCDDAATLQMLLELQKTTGSFMALKRKGVQIPKKQKLKYDRVRANLRGMRIALEKRYSDAIIVDGSGEQIKLRFASHES